MNKNIIFVFTGTGNSLKAARDIAGKLYDCDIVSMGSLSQVDLPGGYETIGFVFPTYYRGEPRRVREFIRKLNLQNNKNAYFYAVTTCGRYEGNTLIHVKHLLKQKDIVLSYASKLDMFSNYVIMYEMRETAEEEAKQSEKNLGPIIRAIIDRETNKTPSTEPFQEIAYRLLIKFPPRMDKNYTVSDNCVKCSICGKVCPVNNIGFDESGKPYFKHHCEQCLACLQFCPVKAINYKDKTQDRKRYTHPAIKYTDLARLNGCK